MSIAIQYNLFETRTQTEERCWKEHVIRLEKKVDKLELSNGKVRRGLYAENTEIKKRLLDLENRYEIIERNICHGR